MSLQDYHSLLIRFNELPKPPYEPTLMEVAGYPHYENVASNILAFFFRVEEKHGFRDLFLRAYLEMHGVTEAFDYEETQVIREEPTVEGKRLDLLIVNGQFVIGIENKIFHFLNNDLAIYSRHINSKVGTLKTVIKSILSLTYNPRPPRIHAEGFQEYHYKTFWSYVKKYMGEYEQLAVPKWKLFLEDFMETTSRLSSSLGELSELEHFWVEHDDEISLLLDQRNQFFRKLENHVALLCDLTKQFAWQGKLEREPGIYRRCFLVMDFKNQFAMDLWLSPQGYKLLLFCREKSRFEFCDPIRQLPGVSTQKEVEEILLEGLPRLVIAQWKLSEPLEDIYAQLTRRIVTISDYLSNQSRS